MAVTVEQRRAKLQVVLETALADSTGSTPPKRRAVSSSSTAIAKRCKTSRPYLKGRSTSTPSLKSQRVSSPIMPTLPVRGSLVAPITAASTLPRAYRDFSHFFQAMPDGARREILEEAEDPLIDGWCRWSHQQHHPLYATETCKTAFLILAEARISNGSVRGETGNEKNTKETNQENKSDSEELQPRQYGCYRCYTLQPQAAFQIKPPHILVSSDGHLTTYNCDKELPAGLQKKGILLRRFCIECGVRDGLYPDRALITSMSQEKWWVCECRRLHWVPSNESYVECGRCLGKSGFRGLFSEGGDAIPSGGHSP